MSEINTAHEQITAAVSAWPGVEAGFGARGEWGFTVDGREIGHLHGNRAAHFGFPRDVGAALREQGRVGPHPVNPHSTKMAARAIESEADVRDVIELMRLNYDRMTARPRGGMSDAFSEAEIAYVAREGRAAIVIDDLASVTPWRPRGIEISPEARGDPRTRCS